MLPGGFASAGIYLISWNQRKGVEDNNRRIILQCFEQLKRLGRPVIMGAPFEWTCSAGRGRTIDLFASPKHVKSLVTGARRLEELSLATQWGVLLGLEAGPGAAMEQQSAMPRKFPK
eukprot:72777-Pyramimonas_sp.AAC.1